MRFTVIPHTHWDREWYFTQAKSRVYLDRYLTDVLDGLDADPRIEQFLFDAQTSLIDDYLKDHPERRDQVRRLVSSERLLTGPWYTQCDQMVVHGEAIVRNLMYGTREAQDLGHCFMVGYAPDCFGQTAQMPQILRGFGISCAMFKRGINTREIPSDDFIWKSDDGSSVFAYHLFDYMNFRNPGRSTEDNLHSVCDIEQAYLPRSVSGRAFLFNGFDQYPLRKDIADIVESIGPKANVGFAKIERVLAEMADTKELPEYSGELIDGETTRVHRSIYSSRADLKRLYAQVENELVRICEPLQAVYFELSGRHERELLRDCWKILMQCDAHDSIGCCNSDHTNRDIHSRLESVLDTLDEYEALVYRQIAEGSSSNPFDIQVFNYLPYRREQEVEMELVSPTPYPTLTTEDGQTFVTQVVSAEKLPDDAATIYSRILGANNRYDNPYEGLKLYKCKVRSVVSLPAMGYETFSLVEGEKPMARNYTGTHKLENEYLRVTANSDGTLEVFDKRTSHTYHDVLEFIDDVDAGDSYDWSFDPEAPLVVSSKGATASLQFDEGRLAESVELVIPANRDERKRGVRSKSLKIEMSIELPADRPVLNVTAKVANDAVDHRLRVLVKTDIPSSFSHADQTFGLIDRPTSLEDEATWRETGWEERPRTICPMQSLCYLRGAGRLAAIYCDSAKEYQIVGDDLDIIAYTLFRSFTKMGRANLPDRPGRESGMPWETPDAALLGSNEYTFAVAFPSSVSECVRLASEYTTPIRFFQRATVDLRHDEFVFGGFSPKVPSRFEACAIQGDVQPSIYKLAEDEGGGFILRLTGLSDGKVSVTSNKCVTTTTLSELQDGPARSVVETKSNQIITFRLK